jgi:toxin ParE1/3/4
MRLMARLELSPEARNDLVEIGTYIARHSGSTQQAGNFMDVIYQTCEMLASRPGMGELRREFATGLYRSFTVGNYVIYFRPIDQGIRVARILHGARDHEALL